MPRTADAPTTTAWLDVSAGVAGDMLLGALLDAGAPLDEVRAAVEAVLPETVTLEVREVRRAGLRATKLDVVLRAPDQPHRRWDDLRAVLRDAVLSEPVRRDALAVFGRLADAEARAHGTPVEDVHFHEVGAWDSVADVVGVCAALHALGVGALTAGPMALGSGRVRTAHGDVPVPVPAVLGLVAGWDVSAGGEGELATPTGAALVTTLATQGALPRMRVTATGVGAGTRDPADHANVVRVVLGTAVAEGEGGGPTADDLAVESLVVLEANVDDLDPRVWPAVLTDLLSAGARDAWLTPVVMKAGRPAHVLSALVAPEGATRIRDLVLDLTTTLGVRATQVSRAALPRGWVDVEVDGSRVGVKVGHRGGLVVHGTPELRDAETAAAATGLPLREVLDRANAAAVAAGVVRGAALPPGLRASERPQS